MNLRRENPIFCAVVGTILFTSTLAFANSPARPIRGSSGNGENSNATNWNLLSVSQPITIAGQGNKAIMTRQIVCINQDVENALSTPTPSLTGSCDSGVYMYLFQLQSTATDVSVTVGQLINFVASGDPNANWGVMVCDDSDSETGNTLELCTTDPNDPSFANIPDITLTVAKNKKAATFQIPNFPAFPAGLDSQGQGLTIFIITNQPTPLPIQIPKIVIR